MTGTSVAPYESGGFFLSEACKVRKYDQIDEDLLNWLRANPSNATTGAVIEALKITCGTTQRHISRRFTLLEDRQLIECTLRGTTRVCTVPVPEDLPEYLHKGGSNNTTWRSKTSRDISDRKRGRPVKTIHQPPAPSVQAETSEEFLAAGGVIEKLPSHWNEHKTTKLPLGPQTFFDQFNDLD